MNVPATAELVANARSIAGTLAEGAAAAEADRRVPASCIVT